MKYSIPLLVKASGNGAPSEIKHGGTFSMRISGTFNGASAVLQMLAPDNATWIDVPDSAMTSPTVMQVALPQGVTVRAGITGSPTDLYAALDLIALERV